MNESVHVAVTGLHAADNPAPGIGIIRSLRHDPDWNGKIIGLAYDVYDTGVYDHNLLDYTFLIPYPNQGSEQVFERIMYIHEQVRIDVLIPTLDSELSIYQKLSPRIREAGIKMYLPSEEMVKARQKANLVAFCEKHDIPTPKTIAINNPGKLDDALDEMGFPLYVKGVFYDAKLCRTKDDALKAFDGFRKQWGLPVLVQESLSGEEFDICAVAHDGELLGALPIRKVRLTDKGKAWAAISLKNKELEMLTSKILNGLKWTGPCELEIMQDSKTKKLYLLEINPRFPAWIYLGTGANQNLPKLVLDLALGKDVSPLPPAKSGVTFVRHATDLVCPLEYIENLIVKGELYYDQIDR
ncbi:ATP-grasp domain-containing protein [bacterium]|nr:ATP-grasp domain-containing protein [bacterium]